MPYSKFFLAAGIAVALMTSSLRAEDSRQRMRLAEEAPSSYSVPVKPTVAELRQARALEKHRQRVARMEANAWAGHSPLRPTVSADPYSKSRYTHVRPYYIWSPWDVVFPR